MFKVLSLDGGGIRGIYSAAFLAEFERNIPLHKCFDLVTGTSTGGIIALGIAYLPNMESIVNLYSKHAKEIFPFQRFRTGYGLTKSKYPARPLINRLKTTFGETVMFDNPNCRLRIQSYDLTTGRSKIFAQGAAERNENDAIFHVWEVAAATSAAPIYFPSFDTKGRGIFIDGGLWANNPALVGLTEALKLGHHAKDVRILSLGTGNKVFRTNKNKSGAASWGTDLIEVSFQSQSHGVETLIANIKVECVKRFSPPLMEKESSLDSIDAAETLALIGRSDAKENRAELVQQFFFE